MFHYLDHPFTVMHDKYGHFTIIILMHDRYSDDPFTDLHDKWPDHLQFTVSQWISFRVFRQSAAWYSLWMVTNLRPGRRSWNFLGGGKYFFHAETGATRFFIVHALPREQNFIHAWSWGGYFIFASHFA